MAFTSEHYTSNRTPGVTAITITAEGDASDQVPLGSDLVGCDSISVQVTGTGAFAWRLMGSNDGSTYATLPTDVAGGTGVTSVPSNGLGFRYYQVNFLIFGAFTATVTIIGMNSTLVRP